MNTLSQKIKECEEAIKDKNLILLELYWKTGKFLYFEVQKEKEYPLFIKEIKNLKEKLSKRGLNVKEIKNFFQEDEAYNNQRLLFFEIKRVFEKENFMRKTKIRKTMIHEFSQEEHYHWIYSNKTKHYYMPKHFCLDYEEAYIVGNHFVIDDKCSHRELADDINEKSLLIMCLVEDVEEIHCKPYRIFVDCKDNENTIKEKVEEALKFFKN
ncbi:hypothetical protein [Fusobacterium necrophorum]|uniref:hypothetical protein n=1 Tax=Fusobacterium necrophorum TaxID=859 RepID=UPI00370F3073